VPVHIATASQGLDVSRPRPRILPNPELFYGGTEPKLKAQFSGSYVTVFLEFKKNGPADYKSALQ